MPSEAEADGTATIMVPLCIKAVVKGMTAADVFIVELNFEA